MEDQATAPTWMRSRQLNLLAGEAGVPAVVAFLLSLYELYALGTDLKYWPRTYLLLLGSLLSIVGVFWFSWIAETRRKQPWQFVGALAGFVAYIYSLYLIGFLGVYRLFTLLSGFSVWGLIVGVLWIYLGYRMLHALWLISEIGVIEKPPG